MFSSSLELNLENILDFLRIPPEKSMVTVEILLQFILHPHFDWDVHVFELVLPRNFLLLCQLLPRTKQKKNDKVKTRSG